MNTLPTINVDTLKTWIDHNQAIVIDVREDDEFKEAHIQGAIHLPLSRFSPLQLPEIQDKKLVIQCLGGKRSAMACQLILSTVPDQEVYNLEGGISSWVNAGFPVTR
ncbi:MAG: rhodanese-like domain-containing protein [Alphaproteobacteria bacterium]|nr:rhodanese-like domain-containing protein [Alphaproteobacteria bacterium]